VINSDFRLPDSILTASPTGADLRYVVLRDGVNSTENDFRLYPNPNSRPDVDLSNGCAVVPLGFTYRYNGISYSSVYVSINGFITFDEPPGNMDASKDSDALFKHVPGGGVPNNVVAPY
jgi:hypothetical protein